LAKTIQKISKFNGGLNVDVNQLDLDESEATRLEGWSVSTIGELKIGGGNGFAMKSTYATDLITQGAGAVNGAYHLQDDDQIWMVQLPDETLDQLFFGSGYGLTTLKSDVNMDLDPISIKTEFIIGTDDKNIVIYDPNHTDGPDIYTVEFPDDLIKVTLAEANAVENWDLEVGQIIAFKDTTGVGGASTNWVEYNETNKWPTFGIDAVSNNASPNTSFITLRYTNLNGQSQDLTDSVGKLLRKWMPNYGDGLLADDKPMSTNNGHPVYYVADGNLRIYDANGQTSEGTWLGYINRKKWTGTTPAYTVDQWIVDGTTCDPPGTIANTASAPDERHKINIIVGAVTDEDANNIGWHSGTGGPTNSTWKIGCSFVYDGNQESSITEGFTFTTIADTSYNFQIYLNCDTSTQSWTAFSNGIAPGDIWNERITAIKLYIREDGAGQFSRDYWYAAEFDLDKGGRKPQDTDYQAWTDVTNGVQCLTVGYYLTPPKVVSFQSLNGRKWNDVTQARFKTAVVANRRAYVGNVNHVSVGSSAKQYEDRVLKTMPNNFDIFPPDSFVDVALNDGESIVKLIAFGDKLLEFKENTLYIINVSQDTEFLESTHVQMGVTCPGAVCATPDGIGWINRDGLHFYDGQGIKTLTEGKISGALPDILYDTSQLGYDPKSSKFILLRSSVAGDSLNHEMYSLDTGIGAITKLHQGSNRTAHYSNFFNNVKGDLLIGFTNGKYRLFKFYDSVDDIDIRSDTPPDSVWESKLYDFGDLALKKKVYKIEFTYKNGTSSGNTGLVPRWYDETGYFSYFWDSTGSMISAVPSSTNWTSIEMFTTQSGRADYIKGFKLKLTHTGSDAEEGYEELKINDISIYYRILAAH
jgi:hypothetical protein